MTFQTKSCELVVFADRKKPDGYNRCIDLMLKKGF